MDIDPAELAEYAPDSHYRSEDPIQNLGIRVTILKVLAQDTGPRLREDDEEPDEEEPLVGSRRTSDEGTSGSRPRGLSGTSLAGAEDRREVDSRIFRWQEKVFGRREQEYYDELRHRREEGETVGSRKKKQQGALEELYLNESTNVSARGRHLFSFVDNDGYIDSKEFKRTFSTSSIQTTQLQRKLLSVQFRPRIGVPGLFTVGGLSRAKTNPGKFHHLQDRKAQVMYINCTPDFGSPEEEVSLCVLKAYSDGSFDMKPGFSKPNSRGYYFKTANGDLYEYLLEQHEEKGLYEVEEARERMRVDRIQRELEARSNIVGTDFQHPPELNRSRVYVFGEIMYGINFDNDSIYCDYEVELPSGIERDYASACAIKGTSQMSYAVQRGDPKDFHHNAAPGRKYLVSNFAFPFELELLANSGVGGPTPKVLIRVTSMDYWDRSEIEGYGWFAIPLTPGTYEQEVKTWKPRGTIRSQMRTFYVGGSAELSDLSYVSGGDTGNPLNRFGFQTVNSGSVHVRFNVVVQDHKPCAEEEEEEAEPESEKPSKLNRPVKETPAPGSKAEIIHRAKMRVAMIRKNKQGDGPLSVSFAPSPVKSSKKAANSVHYSPWTSAQPASRDGSRETSHRGSPQRQDSGDLLPGGLE